MTRKLPTERLGDLVTVAVAPRERHYSLLPSLISLFATIPPGVRVVVAQGDIPEDLRFNLEELRSLRPFEFLDPGYPLYPQEARNMCLREAKTDYIALVDNDIEYEPGWLDALVGNAIGHEADVVAPLIFIGPPRATTIHHAGGRIRLWKRPDGLLNAREDHQFSNKEIADVDVTSIGVENHTVEFHCFLARRDYLLRSGGMDERLTTQEQIHFGLVARNLGAKVTFAENARVTYNARKVFTPTDLDYLSFRWNDRQALAAMAAIKEMWNIHMDEQQLLGAWVRRHRVRAYGSFFPEQLKAMSMKEFHEQIMMPRETAAVRKAHELRGKLGLEFTNPIDHDRRDETIEAFTVEPPARRPRPARAPASARGEVVAAIQ